MERDVRFGVLGPLRVCYMSVEIIVPAAKQRAVLAALALRAGCVVSGDELAEVVWDGTPPSSARVALRTYVMRLRRVLGPAVGRLIVTRPDGYLLEAAADEVDALRLARLCKDGGLAARAGNWQRSWDMLAEARSLWRGRPLSDVPSEALRREHGPALEQLRLQAAELRADAGLALGRHREVEPELRALMVAHPLHERFCAQWMLALARCGRTGEALTAYRRTRLALKEELGIEPGQELRDMHERILAADPSVMAVSHDAVLGPEVIDSGVPVVPRQLPAGVRHFVGRAAELRALTGQLDSSGHDDGNGAAVICVISGTAGIGKTALAVQLAQATADLFKDGQLYINLRGFDPSGTAVTPQEALRYFLGALGVRGRRVPVELEEQAGLYRSLLVGRRVLIVLDNARDAGQVEHLLPASPGCAVLITTRDQLTGLAARHGAYPLTLDVLAEEEARELLASRLGAGRVDAEPRAVTDLIDCCARLPLALTVIGARAVAQPGFLLASFAAALRDESTRLDALDAGDESASVRAAFWWSCQRLSQPAARMFRLLGLHPGPDITVPAAASLAGEPLNRARRALAELGQAHLLAEHKPGRYTFHDLLRGYATEQAQELCDEADRHAAACRLIDHYLHSARAADALLKPARHRTTLTPPVPGVSVDHIDSVSQALTWFDTEHQVLISVINHAAGFDLDSRAVQLVWAMETFWRRRFSLHEAAAAQRAGLAAAQRLGDLAAQAATHRGTGAALTHLSCYPDAKEHLDQALDLFARVGDLSGQAHAHLTISVWLECQERHQEALAHARDALRLAKAGEDQAMVAAALNDVGWFLAKTGSCQRALRFCMRAIALHRQINDLDGLALTLDSLAYIHRLLGNHAEAATWSREAVDLMIKIGYRYETAMACLDSGDARYAAGDLEGAREAWLQAGSILGDGLDGPGVERVRARLRMAVSRGPDLTTKNGLPRRLGAARVC